MGIVNAMRVTMLFLSFRATEGSRGTGGASTFVFLAACPEPVRTGRACRKGGTSRKI